MRTVLLDGDGLPRHDLTPLDSASTQKTGSIRVAAYLMWLAIPGQAGCRSRIGAG
ncbi:hypothetical protein [Kribbella sp.]|uniref:hypothetical protein n=1 Tax=Kribbella sp. TaxID=1871183 RepID=UPI002D372E03|nr:hypothetical protein [Kribbella sp.]HZX04297.1 hypothetical protein [Kribbella sp.]